MHAFERVFAPPREGWIQIVLPNKLYRTLAAMFQRFLRSLRSVEMTQGAYAADCGALVFVIASK